MATPDAKRMPRGQPEEESFWFEGFPPPAAASCPCAAALMQLWSCTCWSPSKTKCLTCPAFPGPSALKLLLNQTPHINWSRLRLWTTRGCCAPWAWGRAPPCGRLRPALPGCSWWRSCSKERAAAPKFRWNTRSLTWERRAQSEAGFWFGWWWRPGEPHAPLKTEMGWGVGGCGSWCPFSSTRLFNVLFFLLRYLVVGFNHCSDLLHGSRCH